MDRLSEFTIYCTEEQTLRAVNLGARPEAGIAREYGHESHPFVYRAPEPGAFAWNNSSCWFCPTTQQMIGWLREKGIRFHFDGHAGFVTYMVIYNGHYDKNDSDSYKQAELAAIDVALDYLEQKGVTK